ncbi:hypothetical protein [Haladaptatus sp. NG-SE-30]
MGIVVIVVIFIIVINDLAHIGINDANESTHVWSDLSVQLLKEKFSPLLIDRHDSNWILDNIGFNVGIADNVGIHRFFRLLQRPALTASPITVLSEIFQ